MAIETAYSVFINAVITRACGTCGGFDTCGSLSSHLLTSLLTFYGEKYCKLHEKSEE